MYDSVEQILAARRKLSAGGRRRLAVGLVIAFLLHAGAVLALVLVPEPPPPPPLEYVSVQVVPLAARGTPEPPRRRPPEPEPDPEPEPPATEPEPETPPEEAPVLTQPDAEADPEPEPEPTRPEPTRPDPSAATADDEPASDSGSDGRIGTPDGNPEGTSPFGAQVSSFDSDFKHDYYIDRMLSLIHAGWLRPQVPEGVKAVLRYRIQKSGEITDLEVVEPSGSTTFDLAALRAVKNAGPLPMLPVSYRRDSLTVTLIVR